MSLSHYGYRVMLTLCLLLLPQFTAVRAAAQPVPPGRLQPNGRFLLDEQKRTVILHGVNYSHRAKSTPYTGWQRREHFEQMRAWGFNCTRLLVEWAAIQPRPDAIDSAYLDHLEQVLRWARECDIRVVLDMHQDLYSASFGGNGAPEWAAAAAPLPAQAEMGGWFLRYFSREVLQSFERLWKDASLLRGYCDAWRALALRARRHPNVIGYDLMNEPFSGTSYPPRFERTTLSEFYRRVGAAIREADPAAMLFFEPASVVNVSSMESNVEPPPGPTVYSPHLYDSMLLMRLPSPAFRPFARRASLAMTLQASKYRAPLFVGEFGVMEDLPLAREAVAAQCDELDRVLAAGWAVWNYNPELSINTGIEPDRYSLVGRDERPHPALDVLVRPYAQAVAGVPETMRFDRNLRRFELVVAAAREGQQTVVFLPDVHFPLFAVEAPGTWTFDHELRLLRWTHPRTRESQRLAIQALPASVARR